MGVLGVLSGIHNLSELQKKRLNPVEGSKVGPVDSITSITFGHKLRSVFGVHSLDPNGYLGVGFKPFFCSPPTLGISKT